ncbi:conserved hypothetical protein [Methylacidiphilum infernorum V4]|uniref:UDP-N-acetyl-alpha-D-muramoyl-L-alanyl-L-glutamate epimerase n=2 Tax=Candidatus Methylacidiphilum infernorum TaxID=511746 RepID=B3DZW6_METI4|nr:conserved hypothetical protein [Methylacidiphilum infernorum V4]
MTMEYVASGIGKKDFLLLRKCYPRFVFSRISREKRADHLFVEYEFWTGNGRQSGLFFHPSLKVYAKAVEKAPVEFLDPFLFHIGLIELVSYWKATCSPLILIEPASLSPGQLAWWRKLYLKGMGEFFFRNGIEQDMPDLFQLECLSSKAFLPVEIPSLSGNLIPVGGGKDSFLTLQWMKGEKRDNLCFLLNPVKAQWDTVRFFDYPLEQVVVIERQIDGRLLELNNKGFLNGHTPFSALLAFMGVLLMALYKKENFVASHESSANYPTIPSRGINHQYSKSYEFEKDFQSYLSNSLCPSFSYFSLLRPLSEIQIARFVSAIPGSLSVFQSCNKNRLCGGWCGQCAKCLFSFLILRPFVEAKRIVAVFGSDLLERESLFALLLSLCGEGEEKPFECLGTEEECRAAASLIWHKAKAAGNPPPLLIAKLFKQFPHLLMARSSIQALYDRINPQHGLSQKFLSLFRKNVIENALFDD